MSRTHLLPRWLKARLVFVGAPLAEVCEWLWEFVSASYPSYIVCSMFHDDTDKGQKS